MFGRCAVNVKQFPVPVAHLSEFVLLRTELESGGWPERRGFLAEFTPVLADQANFRPGQLSPRAVLFRHRSTKRVNTSSNGLNGGDESSAGTSAGAQPVFHLPNQMLAVRYPFRALADTLPVAQLRDEYHRDPRKTLKLLFRLVPTCTHKQKPMPNGLDSSPLRLNGHPPPTEPNRRP